MLEIYILTGGEIFYQIINAIAAFFNSSGWGMLIRWSMNVAVIMGMIRFIGTKDLVKLIRWVFIYIFIINVLVVPKKSVQIIELSDRLTIYKVDNVPIGIAALFSMSTRIGFGIAEMYDQFFSIPDAVTYSKTGFLFGTNLIRDSAYSNLPNSITTDNLNQYVTNCVVGDIMLNHKYSLEDLMNSTNTLELITSNPSPIRRMIYKSNNNTKENVSCKDGANSIKNDLTNLFNQQGIILGALNRTRYSDKSTKEMVLKELLQDSYYFFHKSSKSAVDILKHNIVNNAVRKGISSFASRQGDVAGTIAISAESSQLKSRLNWAVTSTIATTLLPMLHTVMLLLVFGLFPIIIMLTVSDVMGTKPLKLYALSVVYLMSWLPLYSILNYIMVFYTKNSLDGIEVTLNNADKIKLIHSDISMIAGYLSLSIPFLAVGIVKGFSTVLTNASNFLSSNVSGAISQTSSSASDGTWNLGNMSIENVQGYKWDTNFSQSSGNISQQLSSGAISTVSTDGTSGINTSNIMSFLPTTGSISKNASQQFAQAIKYADSMATSAMDSLNLNSRNLFSNLSQLQNTLNKGNSYNKGYTNDETGNIRTSVNEAMSIAERFAKQHGLTIGEAVTYLNYKSSSGDLGAGLGLTAGIGVSKGSNGGKGGNVHADGNLSIRGNLATTTASQDNIAHDLKENFDYSKNNSSDLAKRWAFEIDKLSSYRLNYNGNEISSHNRALLDNISDSYERSLASGKAYNESRSVSYNLSEEHNKVTSGNSVITSNLNNEFVKWLRQEYPMDANNILSNTSDSSIANKREQLWDEFNKNNISNRINHIMESVSPDLKEKYEKNSKLINDKTDLQRKYDTMSDHVLNNIGERNKEINSEKINIDNEINKLNKDINFQQNVNNGVISKKEKTLDKTHSDNKEEHEKQTKNMREVTEEVENDQWFVDKNVIQTSLDNDYKKKQ